MKKRFLVLAGSVLIVSNLNPNRCFAQMENGGFIAPPSSAEPPEKEDSTENQAIPEESGTTSSIATKSSASVSHTVNLVKNFILEKFVPEFGMSYSRGLVESSSAYFFHSFDFGMGLGFLATSTLLISTDIDFFRVFDAEYERFEPSNMNLGVTKYFKSDKIGTFGPSLYGKLPTNPDYRRYLSYQGSLGLSLPFWNYSIFKIGQDHSFGAGIGLRFMRNFYEYSTNKAGYSNMTWSASGSASLGYFYGGVFSFFVSFRNTRPLDHDGEYGHPQYRFSASANYKPWNYVWLSLGAYTQDRTFLHDNVTWNLNIYKTGNTAVFFAVKFFTNEKKNLPNGSW